jgi:hypothetical protein
VRPLNWVNPPLPPGVPVSSAKYRYAGAGPLNLSEVTFPGMVQLPPVCRFVTVSLTGSAIAGSSRSNGMATFTPVGGIAVPVL